MALYIFDQPKAVRIRLTAATREELTFRALNLWACRDHNVESGGAVG
ncbi:hypothetical protein FB561_5707 [Kribbella amoyensis]|uniref:Uncharacterized protein n=1 Tax=Kribbella amoyensis TaxID=996641 RepID=A0A561C041_9ACTN|nr:hypothetical protein [Kribbella amoyensis]TWD84515.1 hypothetical protein FB561_5707 [Kribbella amoyensis]